MSASDGGSCAAIDAAILARRSTRLGGSVQAGDHLQAGAQRPHRRLGLGICLRRDVEKQEVGHALVRARGQPRRQPEQVRIGGAEADEHERPALHDVIQPGQPRRRDQPDARVAGADHRLSGSATRPYRCSSGPDALPAFAAFTGSSRGQTPWAAAGRRAAAASARSHRSSNAVVTTARQGNSANCRMFSGTGAGGVRRLDRLLEDGMRHHVADERDRVEQPPGGGQARDRLARVRKHQVRGQRLGQAFQPGASASSLQPSPATRTT